MIFNYRMCISHVASIARPIPNPAGPRLGRRFLLFFTMLNQLNPMKSGYFFKPCYIIPIWDIVFFPFFSFVYFVCFFWNAPK